MLCTREHTKDATRSQLGLAAHTKESQAKPSATESQETRIVCYHTYTYLVSLVSKITYSRRFLTLAGALINRVMGIAVFRF
jgi:hypothetical protein